MVENFIVVKYDASYIMQINVHLKSTYINLHKIGKNELYCLKSIVKIYLVSKL